MLEYDSFKSLIYYTFKYITVFQKKKLRDLYFIHRNPWFSKKKTNIGTK